jgi:hypothetical protein
MNAKRIYRLYSDEGLSEIEVSWRRWISQCLGYLIPAHTSPTVNLF